MRFLAAAALLLGLVQPASGPEPLPGMPPQLSPTNIYAADAPGALSPRLQGLTPRVYVPNTRSNTVTVIDPSTYRVLRTVKVGREPQHVVPSWDLSTLWVNNDLGNSLTPINPSTGRFGRPVPVHDPYNLYFTPNGKYAVVMASADHEIVFRNPHTMQMRKRVHVPCAGVNHADFSADGRTFVVSCEFSAQLLLMDTVRMQVLKVARLHGHQGLAQPAPQDVKLSPDGRTYYIADMNSNGVWIMDARPARFGTAHLLKTGLGAHGLYVTRDATRLIITNRDEGSVSLLRFRDNKLVRKIKIRGGGSPDMGGLSLDGRVLWLSGRYDAKVYAIDLASGRTLASIPVGSGPHGLLIWPQPGRYSLGHTGIMR